MRWLPCLVVVLAIGGCATNLPEPIRTKPEPDVALQDVHRQPERYQGQTVRWGGTIAEVDNQAGKSCLAVVGRPLEDNGRPRSEGRSTGRFLACTETFLDPLVYKGERQVTVSGTLQGVETRPIGDYAYAYPVVQVEALHLWEKQQQYRSSRYYRDPFWYHPWGPWPYYRRPWFGPGPPYYW